MGYLLSGVVLVCMFVFFGLAVGVDSGTTSTSLSISRLALTDGHHVSLSMVCLPSCRGLTWV
jgi:hypothetical protein